MPPSKHVRIDGCWTCKLRRKKCNENRPICGDCDSLDIQCQYGLKPLWMDGGALQKQKAASFKELIKRNAALRREQAQIHKVSIPGGSEFISDIAVSEGSSSRQPTTLSSPEDDASDLRHNTTPNGEPKLIDTLPWGHQQHQRADTLEQASASEWTFTMKYIDFVFPATFPSYQPHIFDTGRSWLLYLLRTNRIAYHAALGLSCYYFTMALSDAEAGNEHADCKQTRWEDVDKETEKCFESLRADMSAFGLSQSAHSMTTMEKVELMNGITQVIIFEVSMGRSTPWSTHLPTAMRLFEEIMAGSEARPLYRGRSQSKFASVLLGLGDPLWTNSWPSNHIWSPQQACFRFCAGYLIFLDVMASTALGQMPQLASYHCHVLAEVDDGQPAVGEAEIRLSAIVGCRNWIAVSIAEISTITSLKRIHSSDHSIEMVADRAAAVADTQMRNIRMLRGNIDDNAIVHPDNGNDADLGVLDLGPNPPMSSVITLIWGLAAEIYRLTVVIGWNSKDVGIQSNVSHIITLLRVVPLDQLRTLAWPICVAGCLARKKEETSFRVLFTQLSRVQTVGALNDARQVMESVWQNRSTLDVSEHDLASGVSALGSPILVM